MENVNATEVDIPDDQDPPRDGLAPWELHPDIDVLIVVLDALEMGLAPKLKDLKRILRAPIDIPIEIRTYLAERLVIKNRRGRPKTKYKLKILRRNAMIRDVHRAVQATKAETGKRNGDAIKETCRLLASKGKHFSEGLIRRVVYPEDKDAC